MLLSPRRRSQVVRQRSAKPPSRIRIPAALSPNEPDHPVPPRRGPHFYWVKRSSTIDDPNSSSRLYPNVGNLLILPFSPLALVAPCRNGRPNCGHCGFIIRPNESWNASQLRQRSSPGGSINPLRIVAAGVPRWRAAPATQGRRVAEQSVQGRVEIPPVFEFAHRRAGHSRSLRGRSGSILGVPESCFSGPPVRAAP